MKKFFSLLFAAIMATSMFADVRDVLTAADLAATGSQYTDFSGVKKNTAVYAGQTATAHDAIQLRSKNSNSGIVTTVSGGTLKSISVAFNSETAEGRTVDVYASNTAFTSAAELYATGDGQVGEKVASLTADESSFDFTTLPVGYQYVGIRSNNNALWLDNVTIVWASDEQGSEGEDRVALYLNPGELWQQTGTAYQYAVYYWHTDIIVNQDMENEEHTDFGWSDWMDEAGVEGYENLYKTTIPDGYEHVIFVCFDPMAEDITWGADVVYQTEDLIFDGENNIFTIVNEMPSATGTTVYGGVWSKFEKPCEPTYGLWQFDVYKAGEYNEELGQWEILNVELDDTEIINIYNGCAQEAFQVSIEGGADLVEQDGIDIMILENGIYSFYLKLEYGNDKLYIVKEEEHFTTCAEVNAAQKGDVVIMGAFDVVYAKGSNIYIKDETGMTLIFTNSYTLHQGQHVEEGLEGTVDIYNGLPELKPTTIYDDLVISEVDVTIDDAQVVPTFSQINEVAMYRGVTDLTVDESNSRIYHGTFMGQTVTFYNNWKEEFDIKADAYYDILGCVAIYKETIQVYMAEVTEVEAPAEMQTLYFCPANWGYPDYYYAIYYWNEAGSDWSNAMRLVPDESNIYVGQIPAGYTNVIFAAFNPDYTEISWEGGVNYQTVDLVVPEDANMFTLEQLVDDQGAHFKYDGTWSKYEYIEPCVENYGLMEVTGKYTEGTYNEELQQWEILNVELQAGAMFKLYNLCRNETLNVVIAQGAEYFDMGENDELTVKEDGKYNFYLKLDYGNDQLYVTKEETPIVENYDSSADVNNAEKDAQLTLGAFTVVYVNGAYIYIQDENGMTLIYAREYGLKAGDRVAAGLQGVVDIFKGLHEFKPTTAFEDLTIEAGEVPAVKEAAAVPTMADINHMYIYRGVRFNEINGRTITGTFKGETITFYDQFYKFVENTNAPARVAADEQTSYTITGCVSVYNGNLQVYIAEIKEESNTSALEETMMQNNARKMILNGQFYILRDGVIYNAQGAVVR